MSEENTVTVPLRDLCSIADAVSTMMHDLDNGKRKYLHAYIAEIHDITERWAMDETVLGGGCHPDHRCRLCRSFPVLTKSRTDRTQQTDAIPSEPDDRQHPEPTEVSGPIVPAENKKMQEKTHYNYRDSVFILQPLSESVVRVTHRDQMGYFGFNRQWDPSQPYTRAGTATSVHDDGIEGFAYSFSTPDAALTSLCDSMLRDQRREDARRINPEERKRAARQVLSEFIDELPN